MAATFASNADTQQPRSFIINTFYSIEEIFVRELISNASDASDKIRYESITDPEKTEVQPTLFVNIVPDKTIPSITSEDCGIGMSKNVLISNLETIAKCGTNAFMEVMVAGGYISMIGQLGVYFYSACLVADKVRVIGKKHSEIIGSHTELYAGKRKERVVTDSDKEVEKMEEVVEVDEPKIEEVDEEKETEAKKKETKEVEEVSYEWGQLNKNKPLWEDHPAVKHFIVVGQLELCALLSVPRRAPFDLFESKNMRNDIKLYMRRAFFMDDCEVLMPERLNMVKGVVDSGDWPLNISRDLLQQDEYNKLYEPFGKTLKPGGHEDSANRPKVVELVKWNASKSGDERVSLKEYIDLMKEGQMEAGVDGDFERHMGECEQ